MNPAESIDLNDYRYFAAVVDAGGFAPAARALGLPTSRLSRRVAGLEARLGVRLLQRSTRRVTLTDVGRQVAAHSRAMLREAEAAERTAGARRQEPSGRLRVSLPYAVLDEEVGGVFERFLRAYPKVTLETVLTARRVDPLEEGIDLAIRVRSADDEDPQWATRRLRTTGSALVASPAFVAGLAAPPTIDTLASLPALGAIGADGRVHWRLDGPDGATRSIAAPARLASGHFGLRLRAAIAGIGVTLLPEPVVGAEVAAGRLRPVLPEWHAPPASVQVVYPSHRGLSVAARALLDALIESLGAPSGAGDSGPATR